MDLSKTERPALPMKLWQCSRRLTFMCDTGLCSNSTAPTCHDLWPTNHAWYRWCYYNGFRLEHMMLLAQHDWTRTPSHIVLVRLPQYVFLWRDQYVKLTRSKWLCRIPRVSKYNSRLAWSCIEIQAWWSRLPRWYTEKTQVYIICMGRLVRLIFDVYPVEMNWTLWRDATSMMDVERV